MSRGIPIVAVIYFGKTHRWMFDLWYTNYVRSNTQAILVIITDLWTEIPVPHVQVRRVDLKVYAGLMRPHVLMDTKECLMAEAMRLFVGRSNSSHAVLICDLDALFYSDPFKLVPDSLYMSPGFGMVEDPLTRYTVKQIKERNAGVLYFPPLCNVGRIWDAFSYAWIKVMLDSKLNSPLVGQRTWSVAYARCNGFELPRAMNWSRMWDPFPNPAAAINHYHGPAGKEILIKQYNIAIKP